jgi:hypothetical protein
LAETRDDFGWLVTLLEERKKYPGKRPDAKYYYAKNHEPEYGGWNRKLQRRNQTTIIVYAVIIILSAIVPFLFH